MNQLQWASRRACLPLLALCLVQPSLAVSATIDDTTDSASAQALLERAVRHYRKDGKKALATFSRSSSFISGDLYVYVVGTDGVMAASAGPSAALVGRDVRELKDPDGKLFIKEMMEVAQTKGGGEVEYRWFNREHAKVERKIAYFRQVNDAIVVVGYYIPRSASLEAKDLLSKAVEATSQNRAAAFVRFNDINGGFIRDDLYVFVIGIHDGIMLAHGAMPRLVNRKVLDLKDSQNKLIIREMLLLANAGGKGQLNYVWPNPVTRKDEAKTSYFQKSGDYLVCVGYYRR